MPQGDWASLAGELASALAHTQAAEGPGGVVTEWLPRRACFLAHGRNNKQAGPVHSQAQQEIFTMMLRAFMPGY